MAEIVVVGITDRGAESLSPEARRLVAEATLLCGGERHLAFFPDHPAERFVIKANLIELVERLQRATGPVVVLASGDPDWYGVGPYLAERLGRERVRILPNLSVIQLAFARLGLSWHDAIQLSAHGRPLDSILPAALVAPKAVILTDDRNTPAAIARALLEAGDEDALADVFEHLGGPAERHVAGTLRDLVDQSFAPLNLLIVRHRHTPRPWPLGLPEKSFQHQNGLITKAEVRVVSLAKLRLHERATLWDIGAGCGSVAIEAAALLRYGRVYAIERDPKQIELLEENRRRFGAGNLVVVADEAPAVLADLPDPDAVFVGGSGGQLDAILRTTRARLLPGGRIVVNLIGIEHLGRLVGEESNLDWSVEVTQVSVARSTVTAGLTRLAALNPVFVVTFWRTDK
jgi:precorrin-6Y C5,15-methyltransferase (decarboxylating)